VKVIADSRLNRAHLRLWRCGIEQTQTDQVAEGKRVLQRLGHIGGTAAGPFYRNFNEANCLTIVDFSGAGIE
jgi:hypothetical protein